VGRGSKAAEGHKVFIGREADDLYHTDAEHFISGAWVLAHVQRLAAQATASLRQASDTVESNPHRQGRQAEEALPGIHFGPKALFAPTP
jgi:hypothetical protein